MISDALVTIDQLSVSYRTTRGRAHAVSDFSMTIQREKAVGLVGESGCGKTTLAKTLMGLLPPNGLIEKGEIHFAGKELIHMPALEFRKIRWREIAMIPQSAMNSLNPVYRVGSQLIETLIVRGEGFNRSTASVRSAELFEKVGIDPRRLRDYPHQFSGGMKQRSVIALAMTLSPKLVIADEPTTALDLLVQDRILRLLQKLKDEHGLTLLYITHDLSVIARTCDLMGVMYAGQLVEFGPTLHVIREPLHPYTMGLIAAIPKLGEQKWNLVSIPGAPPALYETSRGCCFVARCPFAIDECSMVRPDLHAAGVSHLVACHMEHQAGDMRTLAKLSDTWKRSSAGLAEPN